MKLLLACLAATFTLSMSAISQADDAAVITASATHAGYLFDHEKISSPNGAFTLIMQKDGNLVLYETACGISPMCARWDSRSFREQGQYFMAIQPDGNLVVYKGRPPAPVERHIWSSGTHGQLGNYLLAVQNDGNVVIYRGTSTNRKEAIWASKSGKALSK